MGDSWRYRRMNDDEIKKTDQSLKSQDNAVRSFTIKILIPHLAQSALNELKAQSGLSRIQHEDLFNQKFYRRNENWAIIRNTADLKDFSPEQLRIKWNYLFKHYKELINPPTGVQTEDGEDTAENWEFFELMHSYGSGRHILNPPLGLHNKRGAYVRNPQNSFTGNEESHQQSAEPENTTSSVDLSEDSSTTAYSSSSTSTDPCSSRQLARNFRKENQRPNKRFSSQEIYETYLKECKRQKKETKCFFSFLEWFSNHIGIPFRKPSTSESSDSE